MVELLQYRSFLLYAAGLSAWKRFAMQGIGKDSRSLDLLLVHALEVVPSRVYLMAAIRLPNKSATLASLNGAWGIHWTKPGPVLPCKSCYVLSPFPSSNFFTLLMFINFSCLCRRVHLIIHGKDRQAS